MPLMEISGSYAYFQVSVYFEIKVLSYDSESAVFLTFFFLGTEMIKLSKPASIDKLFIVL